MAFPEWVTGNPQYLIAFGLIPFLVLLTFDHWPDILQFNKEYYWADMDTAARIFRDAASKNGLPEVGSMIDAMIIDDTSETRLISAARGWLWDGVNCDQIIVTGILKNGTARSVVPTPIKDTLLKETFGEVAHGEFVGDDGNVYCDLRFKKAGILSYVQHISRL